MIKEKKPMTDDETVSKSLKLCKTCNGNHGQWKDKQEMVEAIKEAIKLTRQSEQERVFLLEKEKFGKENQITELEASKIKDNIVKYYANDKVMMTAFKAGFDNGKSQAEAKFRERIEKVLKKEILVDDDNLPYWELRKKVQKLLAHEQEGEKT